MCVITEDKVLMQDHKGTKGVSGLTKKCNVFFFFVDEFEVICVIRVKRLFSSLNNCT